MTIQICDLNLWNGGRLFEPMLEFVRDQQADIYLLQEAYDGRRTDVDKRFQTTALLKQALPEYHHLFGPCYLDDRPEEGKIEDGQLIISRWPITKSEMIWFDVGYGEYSNDAITDFRQFPAGVQKAEVAVDGKHLTLLNVHGPWDLDGLANTKRRARMAEVLLENLGANTIMSGDFNCQPATDAIRAIESKLTNVFKDMATTTFNIRRKDLEKFPGYASAVVDFMFVSPNINIVNKEIIDADVSDHLPLVATLELE